MRIPPGPPGRLGPPPCLPWGALGSRRIGLPTSSREDGGRPPPGPPGPRRCWGAPPRPGIPGRWGAPGRTGAPLRGGPLRWGDGRCCWLGGRIGTAGLFWSRRGVGAAGLAGLGGGAVGLLITTGGLPVGLAGGRLLGCCGGRLLAWGRSGWAGRAGAGALAGLATGLATGFGAGLATTSGLRLGGALGPVGGLAAGRFGDDFWFAAGRSRRRAAADWLGVLGAFFNEDLIASLRLGRCLGATRCLPLPLSRALIFAASPSPMELLWLLAAIDSFSAALSTSRLSRPRSRESS